MVLQHFDMGSEKFTSGLTRELLKTLRFEDWATLRGARRAMIAKDLERYDIRPQIRLNADVLKRFKPKATSIDVGLSEVLDGPLTCEWVTVRPSVAVSLYHDMKEDANLGGPGMAMVMMDDGSGGKMSIPQSTSGYPGLIEFRMPCEITKETT